MKRVIIYVEGPSDKAALLALLSPLLETKRQDGISIYIFEAPVGHKKKALLEKTPVKAANILLNDNSAVVIIMPDLYPRNVAFPHETVEQLRDGLTDRFRSAVSRKKPGEETLLESRLAVFCFKHDMEALLLAAEDGLKSQLAIDVLRHTWALPVEDQDHDIPPKRIVEQLYREHGKRYKDTVDAPLVLRGMPLHEITARCRQCFEPFVDFIANLK